MRAVVQRVLDASVSVAGRETGAIPRGLLVYLGVAVQDTEDDARYLASKIAGLRIFNDEQGVMNRSALEAAAQALVVSQFTLLADARKGRRPSWSFAASGETAQFLYKHFCHFLEAEGLAVATGVFGADMQVRAVNDGPVTILLDSTRLF